MAMVISEQIMNLAQLFSFPFCASSAMMKIHPAEEIMRITKVSLKTSFYARNSYG